MALSVGAKAPEFKLVDADKKEHTLSEYLGKKTVLSFFPGAFTGVCTKEMCAFRDSMANLNGMNAQVIGICPDSPFAIKVFAETNKLTFPILSDYTRTAIKAYDVLLENFAGLPGYVSSQRAVFVLDKSGIIKYVHVTANPGVEPVYDEINKALNSL
jgi:peroxiredoxin